MLIGRTQIFTYMYFYFNTQLIFGTKRGRSLTTTKLSHDAIGRYFKFVPKQWTKNGYACMKIEMYGCHIDKGYYFIYSSYFLIIETETPVLHHGSNSSNLNVADV